MVHQIFDAYREKRLMLANAPGSGIADDKAIYSYMPEIVKFYMGDKPILKISQLGVAQRNLVYLM